SMGGLAMRRTICLLLILSSIGCSNNGATGTDLGMPSTDLRAEPMDLSAEPVDMSAGPADLSPPRNLVKVCSNGGWCWENPWPMEDAFLSVWGADASNIWAVGTSGTILKWNGMTWTEQQGLSGQPSANISGVWGLDANNVWAVGASGTIMKWNGTSW